MPKSDEKLADSCPSSPRKVDLQHEKEDHHQQHTLSQCGEAIAEAHKGLATKIFVEDTNISSESSKALALSPRKEASNTRRDRVLKYRDKHFGTMFQRQDEKGFVNVMKKKVDTHRTGGNSSAGNFQRNKSFEDAKAKDGKTPIDGQSPNSNDQIAKRDSSSTLEEKLKYQNSSNKRQLGSIVSEAAQARLAVNHQDGLLDQDKCDMDAVNRGEKSTKGYACISNKILCDNSHDSVEAIHNTVILNPAEDSQGISSSHRTSVDASCDPVPSVNGSSSGWDTRSILGQIDTCAANIPCNDNQDKLETIDMSVNINRAEISNVNEESQESALSDTNNIQPTTTKGHASGERGQSERGCSSGWDTKCILDQLDACAASNVLCDGKKNELESINKSVILNPAEMSYIEESKSKFPSNTEHVNLRIEDRATRCERDQSDKRVRSGWDTRSILEHSLVSDSSAMSDLDGAWNTSMASFATNAQTSKSNHQAEVDISNSSSWKLNAIGFSELGKTSFDRESLEPSQVHLFDGFTLKQVNQFSLSSNEHGKNLGTFEKSGMEEFEQENEVGANKGGERIYVQPKCTDEPPFSEAASISSIRIQEALLERTQERSDTTTKNKAGIEVDLEDAQRERINQYMSKFADACSSSDDEENMSEHLDEKEGVHYVACNADENDAISVEDSPHNIEKIQAELSSISNSSPMILDVAAVAAVDAEHISSSQAYLDPVSSNSLHDSRHSLTLETDTMHTTGNDVLIVSEPDREVSMKEYTIESLPNRPHSLDIQSKRANIPLLPPPPKEKLKKWQERNTQQYQYFLAKASGGFEENNKAMRLCDSSSNLSEGSAGEEQNGNIDETVIATSFPKSKDVSQVNQSRVIHTHYKQTCFENNQPFHDFDSGKGGRYVGDKIVPSCDKIAEKVAVACSNAAKLRTKCPGPQNIAANHVSDSFPSSDNERKPSLFGEGTEGLPKEFLESAGDSFASCDPTPTEDASLDVIARNEATSVSDGFASPSSGFKPVFGALNSSAKDSAADAHCYSAEICNEALTSVTPLRAHLAPKSRIETKIISKEKEIEISTNDEVLATWLRCLLLHGDTEENLEYIDAKTEIRSLLDKDENFDRLCVHASMKVNLAIESDYLKRGNLDSTGVKVKQIVPFSLANKAQVSKVLAANFVSFLQQIGKLTGIDPPFKDANPFLPVTLPNSSVETIQITESQHSVQQLVFSNPGSDEVTVTKFLYTVAQTAMKMQDEYRHGIPIAFTAHSSNQKRYFCPPKGGPGPFETATWTLPGTVVMILGMLGDPVAVCRMKLVNRFCNRLITENEHTVMRDAVRLGGISMNIRPAFWMWITLENCGKPIRDSKSNQNNSSDAHSKSFEKKQPTPLDLNELAQRGRNGKWHAVIERDVARAFGNMPPHKTGARLRADSIVRALVTFGRSRFLKRGVRGGGEAHPIPSLTSLDGQRPKSRSRESTAPPPWETDNEKSNESERSESPTDTVSDWGGVSPVPSFSSVAEDADTKKHHCSRRHGSSNGDESEIRQVESIKEELSNACEATGPGQITADTSYKLVEELAFSGSAPSNETSNETVEELALSGNTLSNEMKMHLQNQLSIILHALAAKHEDVGYCQGLDYVVAHLLRVLQDTLKWREMKRSTSSSSLSSTISNADNSTKVSVFRVMDCFFTTYNLKHMYYPELRSLKICCRVFEKLILLKLPVLADHFEHHELNVGLFALGWFQTLFLYLPSMPTATVCHMWDIWLVERSFKIFFRVGAAILFLSQPILLNHDLEGMMTYLNTFPDATLLKPDILIACALQIKVTNRMLTDLELEVTSGI